MVLGWSGLRWGAPELARTSAIEEVGRVGTCLAEFGIINRPCRGTRCRKSQHMCWSGRELVWHHPSNVPSEFTTHMLVGSGICLAEPEDALLEITTRMLVGSGACLAEFGIIIRAVQGEQ